MAYKRKYQKGGGMMPEVNVNASRNQDSMVNNQMMDTIQTQNQALHVTNAMGEIEARRNLIQQQQFKQQMMLMQARNQMLEQQNQLLQTKIEKDDLINSARTIPSNNQKAMNSPKKRGGSTKFSMGGTKRKGKVIIQESGMNGMMRHGGSCLPGGRYSKKRR
tara:strand:+ start:1012 stop:1497 length:486 start_codon:yes stop_codon:yes gene_type:complete